MLKQLQVLSGHDDKVWSVCWDWKGGTLASCGSDKTIRLWRSNKLDSADNTDNQQEWNCKDILSDAHTKTVRCTCFSPCGRYMASTGFDGLTIIWEKSTEGKWETLQSLEGHENEVKCASWSPSGQYLATCSRDKSVWVWEVDEEEDFQCCSILQHHTQDVKCVKWHPLVDFLVSGSYDDSIRFFNFDGDDWVLKQTVDNAHSSTVWSVAFDSTGDKLVSCGDDRILKIWERHPKDETMEFSNYEAVCRIDSAYHRGPIYSVDWCHLTGYIATGCADNAIRIFRESSKEISDSPESLSFDLIETVKLAHSEDVNCVRNCSNVRLN